MLTKDDRNETNAERQAQSARTEAAARSANTERQARMDHGDDVAKADDSAPDDARRPMRNANSPVRNPQDRGEPHERKVVEPVEPVRRREMARMASEPNASALKLFRVAPVDAGEPPFHFSNTPGVMLVMAESEDYARRMAITAANGDMIWGDEERVSVEEFKPDAPVVLTTNFDR